jgi:hypothetical protein
MDSNEFLSSNQGALLPYPSHDLFDLGYSSLPMKVAYGKNLENKPTH